MGIGGAVQSGRKRMLNGRAENRTMTNFTQRAEVSCHSDRVGLAPRLELLTDLLEVRLVIRELRLAGVEVHRDEIEPLALLWVCRRLSAALPGAEIGPGGNPL